MSKQAVIDAAKSWVGRVPEPDNFMPDITDWLDGAMEALNDDNYPWCAAAVSRWMFDGGERDLCSVELGADAQFSNGFASTDYLAAAFEERSLIFETPEIGDLVLYDFDEEAVNQTASFDTSHIGLVIGIKEDGNIETIEGNTPLAGGVGVYQKTRSVNSEVVGFARPHYEADPPVQPPPVSPYTSFLHQGGTVLHPTDPAGWDFAVSDHNGDGAMDLIGVKMNNTGTGTTEVHVLDGANGFKSFLHQGGTVLHPTDPAGWDFAVSDHNGDGAMDLIGVKMNNTGTGMTEVHVLDGASGFKGFLHQDDTALHPTDAAGWKFAASDHNGDGAMDLIGVKMNNTGTGTTELHVLGGSVNPGPSEPDPDGDPADGNEILFELKPTGASAETAAQDNLPGGVESSRQMAETDAANVFRFAERFEVAADKLDLPPALLAAIASRESRGGAALDENGEGDGGNGVGIMQIDKNFHPPVDIGSDFGSQGHIDQAASIFLGSFEKAKTDHPEWGEAIQLQAATAAYNAGADVFENGPGGFDTETTGGDYSNDVIARAQYYAENWAPTSDELFVV